MDYYITQNINIRLLRVGGITNSSVLQIGSSGCISTKSNLYNTGGFSGPAPALQPFAEEEAEAPLVPLGSSSR